MPPCVCRSIHPAMPAEKLHETLVAHPLSPSASALDSWQPLTTRPPAPLSFFLPYPELYREVGGLQRSVSLRRIIQMGDVKATNSHCTPSMSQSIEFPEKMRPGNWVGLTFGHRHRNCPAPGTLLFSWNSGDAVCARGPAQCWCVSNRCSGESERIFAPGYLTHL